MKGNKILGIIWILIAIILLFFMLKTINKKGYRNSRIHIPGIEFYANSKSDDSFSDKKTFSTSEINKLKIHLASESVYIEKSDSNQIEIEFYCPKESLPNLELSGKTLTISEVHHKTINFSANRRVVIKLPSNYKDSDLEINLASGAIHLSDCNFSEIECNSASGSIHIDNVKVGKMEISSASGSIHIDNCESSFLNAKSQSGSVHISGKFDGMKLKSTSGSIRTDLRKPLTQNSEIAATSGAVKLLLPSESNLSINYSLTSGTYNNHHTGTSGKSGRDIMGSGKVNLDLKTVSGSISIN